MGYELTRFVENVDDEFQCQICTLVLQNPIETPCEHFYCDKCIKEWLLMDEVCPVDRLPLTAADLRPPCRLLRNLIGKFDMKCDFHEDGCVEIVKFDNVQNHCSTCIYNPDAEVTCDLGCNQKISRRDYKTKNCFVHFENKVRSQQEEITELTDEACFQCSEKMNAENVISGLREEVAELNDTVTQHRDVITKLTGEVKQQRNEIRKLTAEVTQKQTEVIKLIGRANQQQTNSRLFGFKK